MVKRKIVWSHRAKIKLYKILEFFANRNQSKTYSAKLYSQFTRELELVNKHPDLGIKTDIDGVNCR